MNLLGLSRCVRRSILRRGCRLIRLEDFEAAQLLVNQRQRLEAFGLEHLLVKPRLDLILLFGWQLLVIVVDVSIQL